MTGKPSATQRSSSEPLAPLSRVELCRLDLLEEPFEHRDEPLRRLELRNVTDPVEDLKTAAQDAACARSPWLTGMIGSRVPTQFSIINFANAAMVGHTGVVPRRDQRCGNH